MSSVVSGKLMTPRRSPTAAIDDGVGTKSPPGVVQLTAGDVDAMIQVAPVTAAFPTPFAPVAVPDDSTEESARNGHKPVQEPTDQQTQFTIAKRG